MNAKATAEILLLPVRFIENAWLMLKALNSTSQMIDVPKYRELAKTVFNNYVEVSLQLYHLSPCIPDPLPPEGHGTFQEHDW